jgi:hypothetical protein
MGRVYYTDQFVNEIETIGKNEQEISYELTDFIEEELGIYNKKIARRIKNRQFTYEERSLRASIIWRGGGRRTIIRAIQNKYCQEDLFDVIGYYLYKDQWKTSKVDFLLPLPKKKDLPLDKKTKMKAVIPDISKENKISFMTDTDDVLEIFRKELKEDNKELYDTLKTHIQDQKESSEIFRKLLEKIIRDNEKMKGDISELMQLKNPQKIPDDKQHLTSLWWIILLTKKGTVVYDLDTYKEKIAISTLLKNELSIDNPFESDNIFDWITNIFF